MTPLLCPARLPGFRALSYTSLHQPKPPVLHAPCALARLDCDSCSKCTSCRTAAVHTPAVSLKELVFGKNRSNASPQDVVDLMKEIATDQVLEENGGVLDFRGSGGGRGKAVST